MAQHAERGCGDTDSAVYSINKEVAVATLRELVVDCVATRIAMETKIKQLLTEMDRPQLVDLVKNVEATLMLNGHHVLASMDDEEEEEQKEDEESKDEDGSSDDEDDLPEVSGKWVQRPDVTETLQAQGFEVKHISTVWKGERDDMMLIGF